LTITPTRSRGDGVTLEDHEKVHIDTPHES